MTLGELVTAFAAAGLAAILVAVFRREAARRAAQRRALTAALQEVLTNITVTTLPSGYEKVTGTWQGWTVIIEPIVDTLAVRKLPALWLAITMPSALPVRASFDLMMRPTGTEIFSGFRDLPVAVVRPPGFPEEAQIRTDHIEGMPDERVIARHLGPFEDGTAKELLIMPHGLRTVWLAGEAARGQYLIFRDAEFGAKTITPAEWTAKLELMRNLREDLEAEEAIHP